MASRDILAVQTPAKRWRIKAKARIAQNRLLRQKELLKELTKRDARASSGWQPERLERFQPGDWVLVRKQMR
jgi:hypothetical protein